MEKYYLGFDAGSTYVKSALIKGNKVICTKVMPTGIDNDKTTKILFVLYLPRQRLYPLLHRKKTEMIY